MNGPPLPPTDGLCFLMWEMSQPRSLHVQKRLQAELRAHPDTPFDQLPYLDAVVTEGLRCFPAIPMSLPRYVPSGGRTIDGYFVRGLSAFIHATPIHTHPVSGAPPCLPCSRQLFIDPEVHSGHAPRAGQPASSYSVAHR